MVSRRMSSKLEFRIKLLSGNNVVLIEANGYESEIFMPEVLNGRLSFRNIIPNRRCCYSANNNGHSKVIKKNRLNSGLPSSSSTASMRKPLVPTNSRTWRMSAGQESVVFPLAYSTPNSVPISEPLRAKQSGKENVHNNFERRYSDNSSIPSPEPPRNAVPTPFEVLKDTLVQIPKGIKVIRLYRDHTAGTPKKVGRIIGMSSEQADSSAPHKSVCSNSNYHLPHTPNLTLESNNKTEETPIQTSRSQAQQKPVLAPESVTKWRKCLTPRRTYSRRAITLLQKRSSGSSVKKRPTKLQSGYMSNTTQGTRPTNKIEMRKRKLVIDVKKTISPASFKNQQGKNIDQIKDLKGSHLLPTTRKQYEMSKSSAFDILTNSNRAPNLSRKLSEQFRKGCVNKASSTYPKYKLLCSIPSLQREEQRHELRGQLQDKKKKVIEEREQRKNALMSSETSVAMIAEKVVIPAMRKGVSICITPSVQLPQKQSQQQPPSIPRTGRRAI